MLRTISRFGVLFGLVLVLVTLGNGAGTTGRSASKATLLTESECAVLLGGQCPNTDCIINSASCGGTVGGINPCSTTSTTCAFNASTGTCQKLVTLQQVDCGTFNSNCTSGCSKSTSQIVTCAQVKDYGGPYLGSCNYTCANQGTVTVANCGDLLMNASQNGNEPGCIP